MIVSEGFTAPARSPRHDRDAFARCYKGASTAPALSEQRLAREQSARQFAQSMALQQQEYNDAKSVKTQVYSPPSPPPTGDPDNYNAGLDAKRRQGRRFGSSATRLAVQPVYLPPVGAVPMGGVMGAAA